MQNHLDLSEEPLSNIWHLLCMTIFLVERNGDVSVYTSPEDAGGAIESPEIVNGEYPCAYDEEGNVFSISVPPDIEKNPMNITLGILTRTAEKDPAGLYETLRRGFAANHSGPPLSVDELISRAMAVQEARDLAAKKRVKKIVIGFHVFVVVIAATLYALYHSS